MLNVPPLGGPRAQQNMLDLIFVVERTAAWHAANLARFPQHYSAAAAAAGPAAIARIQRGYGASIYYHPLVAVRGRLVKYGVIDAADLVDDLAHWNTLYVSGRLHKPVVLLHSADDERAATLNRLLWANLAAAAACARLTLPPSSAVLAESALYEAIAALSYTGDTRMGVAEDPRKVRNIVAGSRDAFARLYEPCLAHPLLRSAFVRSAQGDAFEPADEAVLAGLVQLLPFCALTQQIPPYWPPTAADRDAAVAAVQALAPEARAQAIRTNLAAVVRRSSLGQTVKGLFSAGPVRSVQYAWAKLQKRFRAIGQS
jgi:mitochondrial translocator assembly and maintenance protein 41